MAKSDDIPQDIWTSVETLPIHGDGFPDDDDLEAIARAILAERERCAKLCEDEVVRNKKTGLPHEALGARWCVSCIRSHS